MPTVIGLKYGTEDGSFSLQMVQEIIVTQQSLKNTYIVIADNVTQDATVIKATTGIPFLGQPLYGIMCSNVNPRMVASVIHPITGALCGLWEVDVEFNTNIRPPSDSNAKVNWSGEMSSEHQEFDLITGAKITTTAGEPIFIERPVAYQILQIRRQEAYPFNHLLPIFYVGKVNSLPFWDRPPGTGLMMPIEVEEDTQNNQRVCWVTYQIKFKYMWDWDGTLLPNTWQARPLNNGYMVRPTKGEKPVIAREVRGNPIKMNLDRDGLELKNSKGTNLIVHSSAPGSLNPAKGVYDGDIVVQPAIDDVGSIMIISSGPSWNIGSYLVIGVDTIGGLGPYWILSGNPGADGITGGVWELQRSPMYLFFNRAYTIDFNALSLGPF